jgi:hypothetical protein
VGWYAVPLGRHSHRYYDGTSWTEHVGDGRREHRCDPDAHRDRHRRNEGRVDARVLVDLVARDADGRDLFDRVHRLLDPSHVGTFLEGELAQLLPGGIDALTYADTSTMRLPIDIAFTEQSDRDAVLQLLRADLRGEGPRTGFDPAEEDGKVVHDLRGPRRAHLGIQSALSA